MISTEPSSAELSAHHAVRHAAADSWLRLALVVLALIAASDLLASPGSWFDLFAEPGVYWVAPSLVLIALLSLRHAPSPQRGAERAFWLDLQLALGLWLAAVTWKAFFSTDAVLALRVGDVLYSFQYVFLMRAIERRPQREEPWRLWRYERRLITPSASLLVFGLAAYFILLPSFLTDTGLGALPSFLLYTVLDAYIAGRFLFVAQATRTLRWRVLLGALSIAFLGVFCVDLIEVLAFSQILEVPDGLRWLKLTPFVLLTAVGALRRAPFPPPTKPAMRTLTSAVGLTPPVVTLLWALVFPVAHILVYRLDLIEPALRSTREILVLVATTLLGGLAVAQQRLLERRARKQERQRRDIESALRSSEEDLRLILERRHAEDMLRAERQKFRRLFDAGSAAQVLHRPEAETEEGSEGERIEVVNRRFEELAGRDRDQLQGARLDTIVARIEETSGPLASRGVELPPATTDSIDRPMRLTVLRPASRPPSAPPPESSIGEALDAVELGVFELSARGELVRWNRAAQGLVELAPEDLRGTPLEALRELLPSVVSTRQIDGLDELPRMLLARAAGSSARRPESSG
ncbi:MAG: PAS domain-containing protein [Acidobacteriota bacterium]